MSRMPMPFANPSTYPGHGGVDFGQPYGKPIPAITEGFITFAGPWGYASPKGPAGGLTKALTRADGLKIMFCHLNSLDGPGVGSFVRLGETIGPVGSTGNSTGPHLHLEMWQNGIPQDEWVWMDPNQVVGGAAPAGIPYSKEVENQQRWLNQSRGEQLIVDGKLGPATEAAIKRYQAFLKNSFGYTGAIDGRWGHGTQAAHAVYYDRSMRGSSQPAYPTVSVATIPRIGNVQGLQKIARIGGYTGRIDNVWGAGSKRGFQNWVNANYGGSITDWLRKRWGYVGNDQHGPMMTAALQRANTANMRAL